MINRLIIPIAIAIAALTSSCTMIPKPPKIDASIPKDFPMGGTMKTSGIMASAISWRDYFKDPQLRDVINLALVNNRDLRIAALNIEEARAKYQIQGADLFPSISGNLRQTTHRLPRDLSTRHHGDIRREFSTTGDLVNFELDFFGRVRSLKARALQAYLGTAEAQRSAQIILVAEVANAWLKLAADNERLMFAQKTYHNRQQSFELMNHSFTAGLISEIDLRQVQTLTEGARADVARYTALVAQDRNALTLIVGTSIPINLLPTKLSAKPSAVDELAAGVPSEVLTRRPDILQAERALLAANANIGAARAAFFPSITLTASGGIGSKSLEGLFESGSGTWRFMPQLRIPIFEAGRLRANLNVAKIQRDINVALYEKAIQRAFREVSDALAERASIKEQLEARRILMQASSTTLKLTEARYKEGIDNYLGVLDAERMFYAAQIELIGIRVADEANRVTLYKVLGGGAH